MNTHHYVNDKYRTRSQCKEIDEDSDVAELGQLQEKLLSLNNENFEETRDWITKSMFCQSEEGMHDMIYTFYLIAAARPHDQKSLIFSRMIASLYESRRSNELLNEIPKQCEELLVLTEDMDIEDLVQCLIDNKLLEKSKCDSIFQRKKQNNIEFRRNESYSRNYYEKIGKYLNDFSILYQNGYYGDQQVVSAIKNDDINFFLVLCSEDVNFDYNQEFKLTFRDYSFVFKLIEYAAFNGSINCFKHLLLNSAKLSRRIVRCAFYGGNIEIIRILEQNNMDLSGGIECANNCFHNEIINWLVDTKDVKLSNLFSSENAHVLRMMSNKKCHIRVSFFKTSSIILTRYFFSCFNDTKVKKFAFFNACMSGNVGLVKYMDKNLNCYVSHISKSMNSFHIAVLNNRVEVAEYLINNGGFDCNHFKYNIFLVVIENKSLEMLKILVNMNAMLINKDTRNKVIEMNDPEIFEILFQKEWIRNRFRNSKSAQTCIRKRYQNSLEAILGIQDMFDFCCNRLHEEDYIDVELISTITKKVDKMGSQNFHLLKSNKFGDIDQFYEWVFLLCFRKYITKDSNYRITDNLLEHRKIQMTCELFKKCFVNSIMQYYAYRESNDMFKWLSDKFPELVKQSTGAILNYTRNDAFPKFSKEEILSFLINICKMGYANMLSQYKSILPDFINQSVNGKTMIDHGARNREILEILLKTPGIDFQHDSESPVEFLLCVNDMFDLIIDHKKADLNCVGLFAYQRISLLMQIALKNNYDSFDAVLKKDGIDVNFMMMVKDNSDEYFACYSVIHYLVCSQKTKMLERLLEYPTIDANIASAQGVTPLACAIHLNDVRIINLILSKLKDSLISLPENFWDNAKALIGNLGERGYYRYF